MSAIAETYLRIHDEFVPISNFSGELPDKNYIEGAIYCRIDNQDVFTLEHWDLVDQLWAYILDGLHKVAEGEEFDSFFPDQPLRLRFVPLSAKWIEVTIGDRSLKVNSQSFTVVMQKAAVDFFNRMNKLNPDASETWEKYNKQALSLLK